LSEGVIHAPVLEPGDQSPYLGFQTGRTGFGRDGKCLLKARSGGHGIPQEFSEDRDSLHQLALIVQSRASGRRNP
jgi:hypothetical protein